jgi:hypothetical protein
MIYSRRFNYWRIVWYVVATLIAVAIGMSALGWSLLVLEILRKVIHG